MPLKPPPVISEFVGLYRFLSNFYPAVVQYKSNFYPTVEHAFQAAKCVNDVDRIRICSAKTPGMAKRLGRRINLRPEWESVKLDVMLELLRKKFRIPVLQILLLNTYPAELIEGNSWNDTYWGVNEFTGKGHNHLGKLLMQVRLEMMS